MTEYEEVLEDHLEMVLFVSCKFPIILASISDNKSSEVFVQA